MMPPAIAPAMLPAPPSTRQAKIRIRMLSVKLVGNTLDC